MATLRLMNRKPRSEYGARLLAARQYKRLTQTQLAKAVGMSQSAYGQAETTGAGSVFTSQLAAACGVRAQWLASGDGSMLEGNPSTPAAAEEQLRSALDILAHALQAADKDTRIAIAPLLAAMAEDPFAPKNKSRLILRLLVTEGDNQQHAPHDGQREAHIVGELGVINLGDWNGRSDTDAAAAGEKK